MATTIDWSGIGNGSLSLIPRFASVSASSSGDNEIVAANGTNKIRVLGYVLVSSGTVNAKWRSATTDKSGLLYFVANTGVSAPFSPVGHLETAAGAALNLNLSGAVAVGGHIVYVLVPTT